MIRAGSLHASCFVEQADFALLSRARDLFMTDPKEAGMAEGAKDKKTTKTGTDKPATGGGTTPSAGSKLASALSKNKKSLTVAGAAAAAAAAAAGVAVAVKRRKSAAKKAAKAAAKTPAKTPAKKAPAKPSASRAKPRKKTSET
jgi:hypothetical protein